MTPPAAAATVPRRHGVAPAPARRSTLPPRRLSGPARRRQAAHAAASRPLAEALAAVLGALSGLSRSALLDRLIRGRAAIALVTFALIGIVTLQLGLLKLNSSIGHTLERKALLQRENATLSIEDSDASTGERVQAQATQLGMRPASVATLLFLGVRPKLDTRRAAGALTSQSRSISQAGATGTSSSGEGASGTGASASAPPGEASSPAGGEPSTATSSQQSASSTEEPGSSSAAVSGGESSGAGGAGAGGSGAGGAVSSPSGYPASGGSQAGTAGGAQAGPTG